MNSVACWDGSPIATLCSRLAGISSDCFTACFQWLKDLVSQHYSVKLQERSPYVLAPLFVNATTRSFPPFRSSFWALRTKYWVCLLEVRSAAAMMTSKDASRKPCSSGSRSIFSTLKVILGFHAWNISSAFSTASKSELVKA